MNVLDELEHDLRYDCLHPRDVKKALPALVRVARAADAIVDFVPALEAKELEFALQQLQAAGEDDEGARDLGAEGESK